MDPIDIDIMEEDMSPVAMIKECIAIWQEYGDDDAPETNIVWDDITNIVRQDLSSLRKYRRQKRDAVMWANL